MKPAAKAVEDAFNEKITKALDDLKTKHDEWLNTKEFPYKKKMMGGVLANEANVKKSECDRLHALHKLCNAANYGKYQDEGMDEARQQGGECYGYKGVPSSQLDCNFKKCDTQKGFLRCY